MNADPLTGKAQPLHGVALKLGLGSF